MLGIRPTHQCFRAHSDAFAQADNRLVGQCKAAFLNGRAQSPLQRLAAARALLNTRIKEECLSLQRGPGVRNSGFGASQQAGGIGSIQGKHRDTHVRADT